MTAFAGRVSQVCDEVRTCPDPALSEAALDDRIDAVSNEIRNQVRRTGTDPRATGELVAMLARLAAARGELVERVARRQSTELTILYDQLDLLGKCHSLESLPHVAATAAAVSSGLDRVVVSEVHGAAWSLLAMAGREASKAIAAATRLRDTAMPVGAHVERKVIRTRSAHLAAAEGPHANPEFIRLTGSGGYAVAPVSVAGQVSWFLHADHGPGAATPTERERDLLFQFAVGLGFHLDHLRRRQVMGQQRDQIQLALAEASRLVDELVAMPVSLDRITTVAAPPVRERPPASSSGSGAQLTARELDVLDLVARGWRNADVAAHLVLSEATIKSHMTAIMRKLRVSNRAEAVSAHLSRSPQTEALP